MSEYEKPAPKPVAMQLHIGSRWHIRRSPWSILTACTQRIPYYMTARRWPASIDPTKRCTHEACAAVFAQCDANEERTVPE